MSKHFGYGTYQAVRIADHAILILAVGVAPNLSTRVTLEQLPWRIFPPMFGLFFDEPPVTLPALHPFMLSAVFAFPKGEDSVTIIDAAGAHRIKLSSEFIWSAAQTRAGEDLFIVYRNLNDASCLTVPQDKIVPAIYTRVFGPASQADCATWAAKHCGT